MNDDASIEMMVRLKAYDRRRGLVLRRFNYRGIKFIAGQGWSRVRPDVAAYLRTVRQAHNDETSPLAFDVCTPEEAQRVDASEDSAARATRAGDAVPVEARPLIDARPPGDGTADDRVAQRRPRREKE
jgi:hypothetical protein